MRIISRLLLTLFVFVSFFLIGGCSQIPQGQQMSRDVKQVTQAQREIAWKRRQAFLAQHPNWVLESRVALRFQEENITFKLQWDQQANDQYKIQIKNPITGAVVAKLNRSKGVVTLLDDNGRTFQDTDEERLLFTRSGYKLPLKGLTYWVRGLLSPDDKLEALVLDNSGRPKTIAQAGWLVTYSSYDNNETTALPRKIVITRDKDNVYLKMIAKKWQ